MKLKTQFYCTDIKYLLSKIFVHFVICTFSTFLHLFHRCVKFQCNCLPVKANLLNFVDTIMVSVDLTFPTALHSLGNLPKPSKQSSKDSPWNQTLEKLTKCKQDAYNYLMNINPALWSLRTNLKFRISG